MNLQKQKGAALITALIFLIVLTLVAVSSVQNVTLQEQMVSNVRQSYVALEVAEAGLREGERMLRTQFETQGAFTVENNVGLYDSGQAPNPWLMDWGTAAIEGTTVTIDGVDYTPSFFIERIGMMPQQFETGEITTGDVSSSSGQNIGFRIVARAVGNDGSTQRILEAYVARSF